mmetsp:Transcript_110245/g.322661  ORF Transcript_110245/g.322661 Transcript_110245/m.322661 type:complete len:243 (+) Transcript_110245:555-1283(+)
MDVLEAILYDPPHLLETLHGAHDTDGLPLHQDVALGEQLYGLQRRAVGPDEALAPLHEALLRAHHAPDLDDVAVHLVLHDLLGLRQGHAPRQELDHVPGLDDDVGVPGLARGLDGHGALHEVQVSFELVLGQDRLHVRPDLFEVLLAVLREERRKGALLSHQTSLGRILFGYGHRLPVIDIWIIPWFVSAVLSFLATGALSARLRRIGRITGIKVFALAFLGHSDGSCTRGQWAQPWLEPKP